MRVAFVGHPYHAKTRSADFFLDLIRQQGVEVEVFYDHFFYDEKQSCLLELLDSGCDHFILWQTEYLAPALVLEGRKVVAVPMYDGARLHTPSFWRGMPLVRFISFCRAMHDQFQEYDLDTHYFQYYPEPLAPSRDVDLRSGFAWLRRPWEGLNWQICEALIPSLGLEHVHVHQAIDTDRRSRGPVAIDESRYPFSVTTSDWFENKADYEETLSQAKVFLAPRNFEGIGFSFLEALARGQVVVAPDRPTMNEYIVSGENGLLYNPSQPALAGNLTDEQLEAMGDKARLTVARGRERWEADVPALMDLVLSPDRPGPRQGDFSRHVFSAMTAGADREDNGRAASGKEPFLSIVTVVKNEPEALKRTIASIAVQQPADFEYLVADGASRVETLDVITANETVIDSWWSQEDGGTYDAMQKAASKARGKYILFLNAGDVLFATDSVARLIDDMPPDADIGIGHHVWVKENGVSLLHRARRFEQTWDILQSGELDGDWLQGIPAHQSTVTRTALLRELGYDLRFRIAADHEFLFRARARNAVFHHYCDTISLYYQGGMSTKRFERCQSEWYQLARLHSGNPAVDMFYSKQVGYGLMKGGVGVVPVSLRNRKAEFLGRLATLLRKVPFLHALARKIWKRLKTR